MRIVVYGAGGVGGYFGARLAAAGVDVTFIARGQHLEAMLADGLRVDSIKGDFAVYPVQATADPETVGPVDVIFIGVKAWQIDSVASQMKPLVGPETFIIPLQNGVETAAKLAVTFGPDRVLGGFCRIVSYVAGPGYINQTAGDPYVAFGEFDNRSSERTSRLLALV
jgi:2-dehydropantoate 2-reductase